MIPPSVPTTTGPGGVVIREAIMAAEKAPGLTPQERTILDEFQQELAGPGERLAEAQRAFEADTMPMRLRFRERFAALPPEARSDGMAS
jgi:hypothetical protein